MYTLSTSLLPKRIPFKTVAQFKMHTVESGSLEFKGDDNGLCQSKWEPYWPTFADRLQDS